MYAIMVDNIVLPFRYESCDTARDVADHVDVVDRNGGEPLRVDQMDGDVAGWVVVAVKWPDRFAR